MVLFFLFLVITGNKNMTLHEKYVHSVFFFCVGRNEKFERERWEIFPMILPVLFQGLKKLRKFSGDVAGVVSRRKNARKVSR